MHFSRLRLTNFRNYEDLDLDFVAGINCLTGNNGAGKTNVLEAIHYLAMTRGFHRTTEKYALMEGMPYFVVEGNVKTEEDERAIQCTYMPPKGKKMLVNKRPLKRMSDHIGRIPLVTVLPNDTQLIYGGPAVRRKLIDSLICQYEPEYLQRLIAYEHALAQRNALLSLFGEQGRFDAEELALWDDQLIPNGRFIFDKRTEFLAEYAPRFDVYFHAIVSEKETPNMRHVSQFEVNTEAEWRELFAQHRDRDRFSQRTAVGIHKDDLAFDINGQGVKNFGSQGQQKTFVIALKMAQYEILARHKSTAPVLLLDDIFDKLDIHRLHAIAGMLDEKVHGQVFITDTALDRTQKVFAEVKSREVAYYKVNEGVTRI